MATTPHQTTRKPTTIIQCRQNRKQEWKAKVLHRSSSTDGHSAKNLQFFLSDLGNHKIILGYFQFAAAQPKIDWNREWINHTQLPIILQTPDAQKARFSVQTANTPQPLHQDQYYIGQVIIHPQSQHWDPNATKSSDPKIPSEYQCHSKVFSEQASQ